MNMKEWIEIFSVFDYISIGMLLGAVALVSITRIESLIRAYVGNSWLLAGLMGVSAVSLREPHLFIAALLTASTKGILIPLFLMRVVRRLDISKEIEPFVSTPVSLIISFILIGIVYSSISRAVFLTGMAETLLKVAVSMTLIGLFVMISRRKAVTQVVALLFMENGLFLAGFGLTKGMPTLIELGVLFDLLMGIIILGVFTVQIKKTFVSVDLDRLTTLKG